MEFECPYKVSKLVGDEVVVICTLENNLCLKEYCREECETYVQEVEDERAED